MNRLDQELPADDPTMNPFPAPSVPNSPNLGEIATVLGALQSQLSLAHAQCVRDAETVIEQAEVIARQIATYKRLTNELVTVTAEREKLFINVAQLSEHLAAVAAERDATLAELAVYRAKHPIEVSR